MMVPKLRKSESARDEPVPAVFMVFDRTNSFKEIHFKCMKHLRMRLIAGSLESAN